MKGNTCCSTEAGVRVIHNKIANERNKQSMVRQILGTICFRKYSNGTASSPYRFGGVTRVEVLIIVTYLLV